MCKLLVALTCQAWYALVQPLLYMAMYRHPWLGVIHCSTMSMPQLMPTTPPTAIQHPASATHTNVLANLQDWTRTYDWNWTSQEMISINSYLRAKEYLGQLVPSHHQCVIDFCQLWFPSIWSPPGWIHTCLSEGRPVVTCVWLRYCMVNYYIDADHLEYWLWSDPWIHYPIEVVNMHDSYQMSGLHSILPTYHQSLELDGHLL